MADTLVDLTTLDAAKAHLAAAGVTAPSDATLAATITAVSARLQAWLGRRLPLQAYALRLSGRGEATIYVANWPIVEVSSLRISGVDIAASVNGGHGWIADERGVHLAGCRAERGVMNVELAYSGGYAVVPADIVEACHEAIRAGLGAWETGAPGAVRLKAGDTEIDFGAVTAIAAACVSPQVSAALLAHKRVAPL